MAVGSFWNPRFRSSQAPTLEILIHCSGMGPRNLFLAGTSYDSYHQENSENIDLDNMVCLIITSWGGASREKQIARPQVSENQAQKA